MCPEMSWNIKFYPVILILLLMLNTIRVWYYTDPSSYFNFDQIDIIEDYVTQDDSVNPKMIDYTYSHPLENSCVFPTIHPEDPTINHLHHHRSDFQCPPPQYNNFVHQHEDGSFTISEPYGSSMHLTSDTVKCYYRELTGALWPTINVYRFKGLWKKLPLEKKFTINKEQFVIKCWETIDQKLVYHNSYSNVHFNHKLRLRKISDNYNLAILQIDSTSRNSFFRHCPRTLRFMKENGIDILQGYTKVGDNSAINTLALLSGKVFEPMIRNLSDYVSKRDYLDEMESHGDFQKLVPFLFDIMKERGCVTFFNDDIGKTNKGLFHYQAFTGFRRVPTDYYFRPYFEYIYQNLDADHNCVNGHLLIPFWLRTWKNYLLAYKDFCHFSFNHYSLFTHGDGSNLQLYDEHLLSNLKELKENGVFNNTFILISGDHGQRIHPIRGTYYGRIEERMPLAALWVPQKFREDHPDLYRNLRKNTNRLTSTFDLHETLKDIALNNFSNNKETHPNQDNSEVYRIGVSLFQSIPETRSCREAKIPDNFCVCQVKSLRIDDVNWIEVTMEGNKLISNHINKLLSSSSSYNTTVYLPSNVTNVYNVPSIIRSGPRSMDIWEYRKKHTIGVEDLHIDVLFLDFTTSIQFISKIDGRVDMKCTTHGILTLLYRLQFNRDTKIDPLSMNVEPMIIDGPCKGKVLEDVTKS